MRSKLFVGNRQINQALPLEPTHILTQSHKKNEFQALFCLQLMFQVVTPIFTEAIQRKNENEKQKRNRKTKEPRRNRRKSKANS
jgi:hypothetical protein